MKYLLTIMLLVLTNANAADEAPARTPSAETPANLDKKVALVIGNNSYLKKPLNNAVNDARAIESELKRLGFEVIERENLTQKQIGPILNEFRSRLQPGGLGTCKGPLNIRVPLFPILWGRPYQPMLPSTGRTHGWPVRLSCLPLGRNWI